MNTSRLTHSIATGSQPATVLASIVMLAIACVLLLGVADPAAAVIFEQAKLTAADGAQADHFGLETAIWGTTIVVGVPDDDGAGSDWDQGSAYVFVKAGAGWVQQAKLTAADGHSGDEFGSAVAINGDTIVVGAPADDTGTMYTHGSAYVFARSGGVWTQQAKLTANDAVAGQTLGRSVAVYGGTVVAGASGDQGGKGAAYVFTRSGAAWSQQARLTASDGVAPDEFGFSVALVGDTAAIGAVTDDVGDSVDKGSVYVYVRSGATWTRQTRLSARTAAAGDHFGWSVSLSGESLLVGCPFSSDKGTAYVYGRDGARWTLEKQLLASNGSAADNFGCSVSLWGGTAVVGARQRRVGDHSTQGAAYVFMRGARSWTQRAQLVASDGDTYDSLGVSVGLCNGTAVAGAYLHTPGAYADQGAAYVFGGLVLPRIRGLTPKQGDAGTMVTITGTGFGARRGTSSVWFGTKAVTRYVSWSATRIVVKVPKGSIGTSSVRVRTAMGRSNAVTFTRTP